MHIITWLLVWCRKEATINAIELNDTKKTCKCKELGCYLLSYTQADGKKLHHIMDTHTYYIGCTDIQFRMPDLYKYNQVYTSMYEIAK